MAKKTGREIKEEVIEGAAAAITPLLKEGEEFLAIIYNDIGFNLFGSVPGPEQLTTLLRAYKETADYIGFDSSGIDFNEMLQTGKKKG